MPYIITATTPRFMESTAGLSRMSPTRTRTAVATLDEARLVASGIWQKRLGYRKYGPTPDDLARYGNWAVPESGGTIGPLPDGTVIEVRLVDLSDLAETVGYIDETDSMDSDQGDILAAFNAQQ